MPAVFTLFFKFKFNPVENVVLADSKGLLVKLDSDKTSIVLNGVKSASVLFKSFPRIIDEVFNIPRRIELANDAIENFFLTIAG